MDSCGIFISEEFFMKITRRQLRKLIRESIKKEPAFDPVTRDELDDATPRS